MNRIEKGSITIELLVMLGLIASLTPILYKQVYDRREDIENINQANTLLLLKTSTKEYIEATRAGFSNRALRACCSDLIRAKAGSSDLGFKRNPMEV